MENYKENEDIITEKVKIVLLLERGKGFGGYFCSADNVLFFDLVGGYISVHFIIIF